MKSPHRISLALLVAGLLTAALLAPLHSQTAPQSAPSAAPTIKVETRVVLLDVVVTNNKGQAVPGLAQKGFQILEDGAPQRSLPLMSTKARNPRKSFFRRCRRTFSQISRR